jgi:hypothetical protein
MEEKKEKTRGKRKGNYRFSSHSRKIIQPANQDQQGIPEP